MDLEGLPINMISPMFQIILIHSKDLSFTSINRSMLIFININMFYLIFLYSGVQSVFRKIIFTNVFGSRKIIFVISI